jgi:hypothetical protein
MREHGYEIINARGSAKAAGVFTLGAVWAPSDDCHTMKIANEVMNKYSETLEALAKSRPAGSGIIGRPDIHHKLGK